MTQNVSLQDLTPAINLQHRPQVDMNNVSSQDSTLQLLKQDIEPSGDRMRTNETD